jgi:L-ribulokinase
VSSYAIGVDFGTESGRALLVDCADGREVASAVYPYRNGVITAHLPAPDEDVELELDWALQDPDDYLQTFKETIPALLAESGVEPSDVVGIGIDFTSCTMLPTLADGTPLCALPELRREPHAWVKLWKHHAAQPEADLINEVAAERGETWLPRYGGRISSEWFFAKSLQILREAPEVYARADRLLEAADWVVWRLTGIETRSTCTAGYKAMWSKATGFPSTEYFAALDPAFVNVVDEKMSRTLSPLGGLAGGLSPEASAWTGLPVGTPVAVANVDAHASVPAVGVTGTGTLVMIMGTSICHVLLGATPAAVEGMCGVVEDGVVPGLYGFEAGQSAVGDIFAWFVETCAPPEIHELARRGETTVHEILAGQAAQLRPGESGVLALDWWNGNRSILVDADLSGLLVGLTLATTPAEIYRALIEATAFGTRVIVEAFESAGVAVDAIVACGGLPQRNPVLMQIYADVCGREVAVAASTQAPALGAAMHGAVAAGSARGGFDSIADAAASLAPASSTSYSPSSEAAATYDRLYAEYLRLHDLFGRGAEPVMRTLKTLQSSA